MIRLGTSVIRRLISLKHAISRPFDVLQLQEGVGATAAEIKVESGNVASGAMVKQEPA